MKITEGIGGFSSSLVQDPVLGEIQVYREYLPRQDCIEYTVYFRKEDGVCKECGSNPKFRTDIRISSKDINDNSDLENFVRLRIYKAIINGHYEKASEFIK